MRLGQTSIILFTSKIVGSLLGFLATIYFARVLGEVVLGQFALILAIVTWLGIGGQVGFSGAITKRVSEGEEPERFVGAGLVVICSMLTIISVFVLIFRSQINDYVGASVTIFVILILALKLFKSLVTSTLKGNHLVHIYAVLSSGKQLSHAVAQITLVAAGLGLAGMLYGYAIGYVVTAAIGLWFLGLRPRVPSKRHIVSLFDYAKFSWLGSMRGRTFDTVDIAVLGFFVTQGLIGIYSVAWSIGKFLDIFGSSIRTTLFPEMSKLSAQDDTSTVAGLTEDALSFAGLILIPGLVGGVVIGDRLLVIYGEAFVAGTDVLAILIVALLIYTYNKQLLNTLNAVDRPDLSFRSNAVFIVANVTLNAILIWQIGWIGAAIATALSAAIGLAVTFYYAQRLLAFAIPFHEIIRQWIAALLMGVTVYYTRQFSETNLAWVYDNNTIFVVSLVTLGGMIYFTTYFVISRTFRKTVSRNLPFDMPLLES